MSGRREEILDAAMALADDKGLRAVSMRAVAERVDLTPMALYPHVGGKAALLDGMAGRLLADLVPRQAEPWPHGPQADWRGRLGEFAHSVRRLARRHPWAAGLLFSRPSVAPDALRAIDVIYAVLLDAGVPDREVPRVERMVSTFILGYTTSEVEGRFGTGTLSPRARRAQLPEEALPAHAHLARWLDAPVDRDAEFDADLEDLVRLIESIATARRAKD